MYGTLGRILSVISYVVIIITSMQVGGAFDLLPPKWAATLLVISATLTAFSERIQGGASNPSKRAAAAAADQRKTSQRGSASLALIIVMTVTMPLGVISLKACSKTDRDPVLLWAKDVVTGFTAAAPYIKQLAPDYATRFEYGVTTANELVSAIQNSTAETLPALLADLSEIARTTYQRFNNNPTVLAAFALADIGIHFLINRIATGAAANRVSASNKNRYILEAYSKTPIWGCEYKPEKCVNGRTVK